jgi:endonuclease I
MNRKLFFTAWLLTLAATSWAQGPNNSGEYYKAADGKKGAELKTALCGVIYDRNEGGSLDNAYKALWTHFRTTDALSNGKVWDMYSNLREMEFGTDQAGNYKKEGDVYNREHSMPNSWFGGKVMPMYTDLYHMYPTDGYVNSKRSNHPFGETNGESYKSANNFSKLGKCTFEGYDGTVFEPNDEYKGDFARTYFYMVTCYEEKIVDWYTNYGVNGSGETQKAVLATFDGNKYPGLSEWQLKMLMKWAKNDPVSEKETNRNNAVYDIQNNRNPFIDYPGLEEYIWGDKVDEAFSYDNYSTDIQDIMAEGLKDGNQGTKIYSADGLLRRTYQRGINIMKQKNGRTRKVMKK